MATKRTLMLDEKVEISRPHEEERGLGKFILARPMESKK